MSISFVADVDDGVRLAFPTHVKKSKVLFSIEPQSVLIFYGFLCVLDLISFSPGGDLLFD